MLNLVEVGGPKRIDRGHAEHYIANELYKLLQKYGLDVEGWYARSYSAKGMGGLPTLIAEARNYKTGAVERVLFGSVIVLYEYEVDDNLKRLVNQIRGQGV